MKIILYYIFGIILLAAVVYYSYGIAKAISYSIFYEDMVRRTVVEMVRPEALK